MFWAVDMTMRDEQSSGSQHETVVCGVIGKFQHQSVHFRFTVSPDRKNTLGILVHNAGDRFRVVVIRDRIARTMIQDVPKTEDRIRIMQQAGVLKNFRSGTAAVDIRYD